MEKRGKAICEALRAVRGRIAAENGIQYSPRECTHEGPCEGTCPACEAELAAIERELVRRSHLGHPGRVVGLGMLGGMILPALVACDPTPSGNLVQGEVAPGGQQQEEAMLQGNPAPVPGETFYIVPDWDQAPHTRQA